MTAKKTTVKYLKNKDLMHRSMMAFIKYVEANTLKGIEGSDKLRVVIFAESVLDAQKSINKAREKIIKSYPTSEEGEIILVNKDKEEECLKEIEDMLAANSELKVLKDIKLPKEVVEDATGIELSGFMKVLTVE